MSIEKKIYQKKWYQDNKDRLIQKYQNNKEYMNQNSKEYYQENKDEINKRRNEKVQCECGCELLRSSLSKHKRTQIHLNNIPA